MEKELATKKKEVKHIVKTLNYYNFERCFYQQINKLLYKKKG